MVFFASTANSDSAAVRLPAATALRSSSWMVALAMALSSLAGQWPIPERSRARHINPF